jgi:hypothetical protein
VKHGHHGSRLSSRLRGIRAGFAAFDADIGRVRLLKTDREKDVRRFHQALPVTAQIVVHVVHSDEQDVERWLGGVSGQSEQKKQENGTSEPRMDLPSPKASARLSI